MKMLKVSSCKHCPFKVNYVHMDEESILCRLTGADIKYNVVLDTINVNCKLPDYNGTN